MGNRFDALPKKVQRLVKKLADIQREELAVLRARHPDEESRVMKIIERGDSLVNELMASKFAMKELGVCYPDSPDDLQAMGEFFLGEYAMERLFAEENGEEYSEDLFYAGAYLKQSAEVLADAGCTGPAGGMLEDLEDKELDLLLDKMMQDFSDAPSDGRIVPLFGARDMNH